MASRSQIDALTRRVDQLVLLLKPAEQLPECPVIKLALDTAKGNTLQERAEITAYLERARLRKERPVYEVHLDFDGADCMRENGHADVPQSEE